MANTNNLRLNGLNPLSYLGVNPVVPVPAMVKNYSPTVNDVQNISLMTLWLNTTDDSIWMLVGISNYQAQWIQIGTGGSGGIQTLTSNDSVVVGPSSGNINVIGDGTYIVGSGNASSNTITLTGGSGFLKVFDADMGSATPSGGVINISGGTGIATTAMGNTVTISLSGATATSYQTNSGVAIPAAGILQIVGGGDTTTSASGNVVTVSTSSLTATLYETNSGNAVPSGGAIQIKGGSGVLTTTGSGNTVTTNLTSATDGQVIIGSSAGNPAWSTLTAGSGISITNGHNSISISSSGSSLGATTAFGVIPENYNEYVDTGGFFPMILDSVLYDLGSNYDSSTYTYTAPRTGYYQHNVYVIYIFGTGTCFVGNMIQVVGASAGVYPFNSSGAPTGATGYTYVNLSLVIPMTQGDTAQIILSAISSGPFTVGTYPGNLGNVRPTLENNTPTMWSGYQIA